ncbi:retrotransposon protein, putative, ty1-copia subclass [Tanacetum coccineum]
MMIVKGGSYEIDLSNSNTNDSSMYAVSNKRAKLNLDSALLWHYRLGHISKKRIEKLQHDGLLNSSDIHSFWENINSLITQEASGSLEDLEIIQEEDMHPSENTSLHHDEGDQEIDKPQSDIIPICKSTRTRHDSDRMCLNIDAEEYELGDLNEPANYKAALLDPGTGNLVDLPPNDKTVGSKWLFKKKTNIDGAVHIYKARLVAKGFTQTYRVDYEETFSPIADIRAIRILIAITACFALKDLGEAAYILEIKIYRDRSRQLIGLCQSTYIEKILKKNFMKNSKSGSIPMQEKLKLSKSQGALTPAEVKRMQNITYALAVGSIMYAVRCTRPDVAFAQNITRWFQQNPGELYWTAVKNILKYLRNTKDIFLVYGDDIKRELRVSC